VRADLHLSPEELAELAERVAQIVLERQPAPAAPSPYLSVNEAAEFLRAPRSRVYDLVSAGRLTRYKDGARVLVSRAELEAHLSGVAQPLPSTRQTRMAKGRRA
jgi:excisionase family DNA binding protein